MNKNQEKIKIMIVEDEAVTALDIELTLESLGYKVVGIASNGPDALDLAWKELPDLVMMDIKIQGEMEGIEVAAYLFDNLKIPSVFLTSHSDNITLSRAQLLNPYGFLLKPFMPEQLRTTILMALERFSAEKHTKVTNKDFADQTVGIGSKDIDSSAFLKRIPIFSDIAPEQLERIAKGSDFKTFSPKKVIVQEGQLNPICFIVATGRIACCQSSENGKELIHNLLAPGDIFGIESLIEERPSTCTIRAERESKLLMLPLNSLKLILNEYPELYKEFLEIAHSKLEEANKFASSLAYERVETRIASALLNLLASFGKKNPESGNFEIDIVRHELADLSGTTTETVIRTTRAMEKQKILNLSKPGLITVTDFGELEALGSSAEI